MILDTNTYFDCGLPTSNDISAQEVEFAITTIEQYYVKPRLGAELYADIADNPSNYEEALNGSNNVAGLKTAVEHLVYAYMLWDRTRLTRYTTVVKSDEHSTEPKSEDLYQICKAHWEIGEAFVLEVCKFLNAPEPNYPLNNLVFGELMLSM